jgi:hypothetical protein
MTTIFINSPTNIFLSDLRGGEIINRGSFGYIFKPNNDKNIVIKIVVCIKENKNYVLYLDNEIDIHKKLSLYGDTYFMKLYGYFLKNKKNIYEYKTLSDEYKENKIQISTSDNNFLEDACEVYLLCEEAKYDLKSLLGEKKLDHTFLYKFIGLFNFTNVSLKFIETENKIFIHSDIKLENIVETKTGDFKFIDFGLSKLSNTFFLHNSDGTENILKLLFTLDDLYDPNLCVVSPLFDIFSVIICIFGLSIQSDMINITVKEIQKIVRYQINYYKLKQDNFWLYLEKLLLLFNSIFEFHQIKIKKYYIDKNKYDTSMFSRLLHLFSNPLDTYITSFLMKDFKLLSQPNDIIYKNTQNENIDSINYMNEIITYLFTDINTTQSFSELEEVIVDIQPEQPRTTYVHPAELEEIIIDNPEKKYYTFTKSLK